MTTNRFYYNPHAKLIELPGQLFGPLGDANAVLLFDPGSFRTIISSRILDKLGYDTKSVKGSVQTTSVTGVEKGSLINVCNFTFLDFTFENIEIASFDLPARYKIDGLIGLDILEQFEIRLNHRGRWIEFSKLDR